MAGHPLEFHFHDEDLEARRSGVQVRKLVCGERDVDKGPNLAMLPPCAPSGPRHSCAMVVLYHSAPMAGGGGALKVLPKPQAPSYPGPCPRRSLCLGCLPLPASRCPPTVNPTHVSGFRHSDSASEMPSLAPPQGRLPRTLQVYPNTLTRLVPRR